MTDHHVRQYLRAIAALALECADRLGLLADFVAIVALVPRTPLELRRDAWRHQLATYTLLP